MSLIRHPLRLFLALWFVLAAPLLHAQAPSPRLAAVLAQMDAASSRFQNASASFEWDFYQRVVRDTTKQKGTMFLERTRGGIAFGAVVFNLDPGGKPQGQPAQIVDFSGSVLRVYTPGTNQVDRFNAGPNQASYESFLSIGFGGSGHDLAQAWQIADGGSETLTDNGHPVKTEKLILTSKDPNIRNTFTHVTIWIDPTRDVSLKQIFETPSGDQRTAYYSDIHLNGKIDNGRYRIPKNATVVQH